MTKNKYTLEDFVKGRVDDETLDRIAKKADELQNKLLKEDCDAISTDWNVVGDDMKTSINEVDENLAKMANDFEEEHGYCPDYGYENPDAPMPNTDLTLREAFEIVEKALKKEKNE